MKPTLKIALAAATVGLLTAGTALAAKDDAGHDKDYRTFHADGTIEYGQIGDSYTSALVMYLAGNQLMVMTEGIFKFYGSAMLKDLGLHDKVTGGAQCKSCWAVPNTTWFTSRHHRETPQRIENAG